MKSILSEICYHIIEKMGDFVQNREKEEKQEKCLQKLLDSLSPKQKDLFDDYEDCSLALYVEKEELYFIRGFKTAVAILLESVPLL